MADKPSDPTEDFATIAREVSKAGHDIGSFIRSQRMAAEVSIRQLAERAGVSNPYLSQVERGLRNPSGEVLSALARALRVSAESMYVKAGLIDDPTKTDTESVRDHWADDRTAAPPVVAAITNDPHLNDRQKAILIDIYESYTQEEKT